jgi:hypothetical protein
MTDDTSNNILYGSYLVSMSVHIQNLSGWGGSENRLLSLHRGLHRGVGEGLLQSINSSLVPSFPSAAASPAASPEGRGSRCSREAQRAASQTEAEEALAQGERPVKPGLSER